MSNGTGSGIHPHLRQGGGVGGQTLSTGEIRALAGELAEDLAARGLSLGDVERLAPLLVDRFRQVPARAPAGVPVGARAEGGAGEHGG